MNPPLWLRRRSQTTLRTWGSALVVLGLAIRLLAGYLSPGGELLATSVFIIPLCAGAWLLGASFRQPVKLNDRGVKCEGTWFGFTVPWDKFTGADVERTGSSLRLRVHHGGVPKPVVAVTRPDTPEGRAEMEQVVAWLNANVRASATAPHA